MFIKYWATSLELWSWSGRPLNFLRSSFLVRDFDYDSFTSETFLGNDLPKALFSRWMLVFGIKDTEVGCNWWITVFGKLREFFLENVFRPLGDERSEATWLFGSLTLLMAVAVFLLISL